MGRRPFPARRNRRASDLGPSDAELLASKVDPEIVARYGEPKPATAEQRAELAAAVAANGGVIPLFSFDEIIELAFDIRQETYNKAMAETEARDREPSPEVRKLSERWARHELTDAEFADAAYEDLGLKPRNTKQ